MSQAAADQSGPVKRQTTRGDDALRKFHDEDDLERVYDLRMIARLWPNVAPHRALLLGSLLLLLTMAGLALVRPLIMKTALEGLELSDELARAHLLQWGVILVSVMVVEQVLAFPQMYWVQVAGARAMAQLRRRLFTFLHERSLSFFDKTPIGRLVTRVTNDVDAIGEMFSSGALNAVGDLIRLVAIVVIMMSMDVMMSVFAFAVLPLVFIGVNWTRKKMRVAYREVRSKTARINAFINEQVSGIEVVQAYAREERSEEAFDRHNYDYRTANLRAIGLDATLDAAIEMLGSFCIASVLWYAGAKASGRIDFPTLFAFVAYIDMFFMPVRNLSARYTQIQSALAGSERVFQLLASEDEDAALEVSSQSRSDWPDPDEPIAFALRNVTFGYKPSVPVLHDVSIEAKRGETIAVVGPTGSGKSTVASLLLRLYEVSRGDVEVFGVDVRQLDRRDLRSQFAVVPQDVFLFPGTIASNIAAGDADFDKMRVRDVLDNIGALDLFERRDGGLDAEVLERGSNFSAGERQLIAFARALYRNPPLLILDEPTASIDSDTEARLQIAMDRAMEGRTALMIAHRLSTIRSANRIVALHQGCVIEQGTHEELLEQDGVYARLYRLQVARKAIDEKAEKLVLEK